MIKRSLLLVAFCLAALLPAQAQVVIKERVEVWAQDSLRQAMPTDAAKNTATFTAPASGKIRLRYVHALRKEFAWQNRTPPTLTGHTLQIEYSANGTTQSLLDQIQPPPAPAKADLVPTAGPRFKVLSKWRHCEPLWWGWTCAWAYAWAPYWYDYSSNYYFSNEGTEIREEAIPVIELGEVNQGDEINLALTYQEADGETHVLEFSPVRPQDYLPGVAWALNGYYFGGYYSPLGGIREDLWVVVELLAPQLKLLMHNDKEIPQHSGLMVSSFPTDVKLDPQTPFTSEYASAAYKLAGDEYRDEYPNVVDANTFRPQVTGIVSGKRVEFMLEVLRGGAVLSSLTQTYQSVEGVLDDEPAYRSAQHVRLVSNAKPASHPASAQYDDEVLNGPPDQTIRVELGDVVRFTLVVDGEQTTTKIERSVGLPPSGVCSSQSIQLVEINWQRLASLKGVNLPLTTARMSEDWAQAAVHFKSRSETTFSQVPDNILYVHPKKKQMKASGSLSVRVKGQATPISLPYSADMTRKEVVEAFAATLEASLGVSVQVHPAETVDEKEGILTGMDKAETFYIIVGKDKDIDLEDISDSDIVKAKIETLSFKHLQLHHLAALASSLRDEDPLTADAFVLNDEAMLPEKKDNKGKIIMGKGFSDDPRYYAMPHTLFLSYKATQTKDDFPLVASHEMGHTLMTYAHAETLFQGKGYPVSRHLMYGSAVDYEVVRGPKRLSDAYKGEARRSSLMQPGSSCFE